MACSAWNLRNNEEQRQHHRPFEKPGANHHDHYHNNHLRSLLSSKSLVEHLGVRVDAKVRDSLSVGRGSSGVSPSLHSSNILDSREGVTAESLHDEEQIERKKK